MMKHLKCVMVIFALLRAAWAMNEDNDGTCCAKLKAMGYAPSQLPVVIIDTNGAVIPGAPPSIASKKIQAHLCTCSASAAQPPDASHLNLVPSKDYNGAIGIEIRGSTTRKQFVKKSYALELRHNATSSKSTKFPLLGLPSADSWVIYGPEMDAELGMRNWFAQHLWRAMNDVPFDGAAQHWGPRVRFVEAFVNTDKGPLEMKHYNGLYLLVEPVERAEGRLDFPKAGDNQTTVSGTYIFKYDNDNIDKSKPYFTATASTLSFAVKEPSDPSSTQLQYLASAWNQLESSLLNPSFADPNSGYKKHLYLPHAVDYFLLSELTKNPDAYRGSTYINKPRASTFRFGPPWDYNEAFGSCCGYPIEGYQTGGKSSGLSGGSAISTEGWRFNICAEPMRCRVDPLDGVSPLFRRMWSDPAFRQAAAQRYASLRASVWSDAAWTSLFDATSKMIRTAAVRNYARWASVLMPPSSGWTSGEAKWSDEVRKVREWSLGRMKWMDEALKDQAAAS